MCQRYSRFRHFERKLTRSVLRVLVATHLLPALLPLVEPLDDGFVLAGIDAERIVLHHFLIQTTARKVGFGAWGTLRAIFARLLPGLRLFGATAPVAVQISFPLRKIE